MDKKTFKTHMTAAVILAVIQTAACFLANDFDAPLIFMLITNIAYTAWISTGNRGYAPWPSCFGFIAVQAVQLWLNKIGFVPSHNDLICTGLGQFFYCAGLLLTAALFFIVNLIRWVQSPD